MKINGLKPFLIPVLVLVFFVILFNSAFQSVEAGTVKVVTRFGGTTNRVMYPGANFKIPFVEGAIKLSTKTVIYETTTEAKQQGSDADYKDFPVDTNTKDGQQVDIFFTVRFNIDPDKAVWIVNNIGNERQLVEKVVKTEARIWVRNIPREYEAEQLYTGDGVQRAQVDIENKLRPVFEANGLRLDSVGIREIKFSEDYIKAIEQKQIEQVRVETEKNKADQAVEVKRRVQTEAEAKAFEQQAQSQTLTPQFLEKLWIEKWDGKLPVYVTGDAENLIQLPTNN